jgi:hypothetical protein
MVVTLDDEWISSPFAVQAQDLPPLGMAGDCGGYADACPPSLFIPAMGLQAFAVHLDRPAPAAHPIGLGAGTTLLPQ